MCKRGKGCCSLPFIFRSLKFSWKWIFFWYFIRYLLLHYICIYAQYMPYILYIQNIFSVKFFVLNGRKEVPVPATKFAPKYSSCTGAKEMHANSKDLNAWFRSSPSKILVFHVFNDIFNIISLRFYVGKHGLNFYQKKKINKTNGRWILPIKIILDYVKKKKRKDWPKIS